MNDPADPRNEPWQRLQRSLAESVVHEANRYPTARKRSPPHWRFAHTAGSWMSRTRAVMPFNDAG